MSHTCFLGHALPASGGFSKANAAGQKFSSQTIDDLISRRLRELTHKLLVVYFIVIQDAFSGETTKSIASFTHRKS